MELVQDCLFLGLHNVSMERENISIALQCRKGLEKKGSLFMVNSQIMWKNMQKSPKIMGLLASISLLAS